MRYRVRGKLPTGQLITSKPVADHEFEAVSLAAREFRDGGHVLSSISGLKVVALPDAKSSIHVGKVPTKRTRKPTGANTPSITTTPVAQTTAAPAAPVPVAGKAGNGGTATKAGK